MRTCYLPSVRQHLTAFDGDNGGTAAHQRTPGAAPLALFHRLRLWQDYFALAGFSGRYRQQHQHGGLSRTTADTTQALSTIISQDMLISGLRDVAWK